MGKKFLTLYKDGKRYDFPFKEENNQKTTQEDNDIRKVGAAVLRVGGALARAGAKAVRAGSKVRAASKTPISRAGAADIAGGFAPEAKKLPRALSTLVHYGLPEAVTDVGMTIGQKIRRKLGGIGRLATLSQKLNKVVRRSGNKYVLYSKDGSRKLGEASTRAGIERRERQVEYFKHKKNTEPGDVNKLHNRVRFSRESFVPTGSLDSGPSAGIPRIKRPRRSVAKGNVQKSVFRALRAAGKAAAPHIRRELLEKQLIELHQK